MNTKKTHLLKKKTSHNNRVTTSIYSHLTMQTSTGTSIPCRYNRRDLSQPCVNRVLESMPTGSQASLLTVAAFAVCIFARKTLLVSKLPTSFFRLICAWLISTRTIGAPLRSHLLHTFLYPSQQPGILCNNKHMYTLFVIVFHNISIMLAREFSFVKP